MLLIVLRCPLSFCLFLFLCVVSVFGRATPCLLPSLSPCVSHVFLPCVSTPFPCLVLSSPHVCGGCHTSTLCPAVLLPHQSSLSVSLPPLSPSSPHVCVKRVCVGNGKEDEQTCVIQKACGEKGVQKEKQKTTCGVNTLSPTLVPTTPTHPSLHSSHHKSCFPLAVTLTLSLFLLFGLMTRGEWFE